MNQEFIAPEEPFEDGDYFEVDTPPPSESPQPSLDLYRRILLAAAHDRGYAESLLHTLARYPNVLPPAAARTVEAIESVVNDIEVGNPNPTQVVERSPSARWMLEVPDKVVKAAISGFDADIRQACRLALVNELQNAVKEAERAAREGKDIPKQTQERLIHMIENIGKKSRRRPSLSHRDPSPRKEKESRLIHFGFKWIDKHIGYQFSDDETIYPGGYRTGDLIVIGAESGVGKTTFSLQSGIRGLYLYNRLHRTHHSMYCYSYERTDEDQRGASGFLSPRFPWARHATELDFSVEYLDGKAIRPNVNDLIEDFVGRLEEIILKGRRKGLDQNTIRSQLPLILNVDYAKLFTPPGMNLVNGIEEVAKRLKSDICLGAAFRRDRFPELEGYNPVVWLPTQVKPPKPSSSTRNAQTRTWQPSMDDIADCRAIVDYADVVLLLHQEPGPDGQIMQFVKLAKGRRMPLFDWTPLYRDKEIWFSPSERQPGKGFFDPEGTADSYIKMDRLAQEHRRERTKARQMNTLTESDDSLHLHLVAEDPEGPSALSTDPVPPVASPEPSPTDEMGL